MRNLNIDGSIQRLTSVDPSIRHLSFSTLPAEQRETKSEKERESASRRRRGRAEREDGGKQRKSSIVFHVSHSESLLNFTYARIFFKFLSFVSCYSRLIFFKRVLLF